MGQASCQLSSPPKLGMVPLVSSVRDSEHGKKRSVPLSTLVELRRAGVRERVCLLVRACFFRGAEMGLLPEIGGGRLTACEGKCERALVWIGALDFESGRLIAGR